MILKKRWLIRITEVLQIAHRWPNWNCKSSVLYFRLVQLTIKIEKTNASSNPFKCWKGVGCRAREENENESRTRVGKARRSCRRISKSCWKYCGKIVGFRGFNGACTIIINHQILKLNGSNAKTSMYYAHNSRSTENASNRLLPSKMITPRERQNYSHRRLLHNHSRTWRSALHNTFGFRFSVKTCVLNLKNQRLESGVWNNNKL